MAVILYFLYPTFHYLCVYIGRPTRSLVEMFIIPEPFGKFVVSKSVDSVVCPVNEVWNFLEVTNNKTERLSKAVRILTGLHTMLSAETWLSRISFELYKLACSISMLSREFVYYLYAYMYIHLHGTILPYLIVFLKTCLCIHAC